MHRGVDSLQTNEKGPTLEPWASSCCFAAPQVLEFDAAGTLLANWEPKDRQGYDWPQIRRASPSTPRATSGSAAACRRRRWRRGRGRGPRRRGARRGAPAPRRRRRGAAGRGADAGSRRPAPGRRAGAEVRQDRQVPAADRQGRQDRRQRQHDRLQPAGGVAVDAAANEVYVADDCGNHRVAVFDANTGAFKRSWGAYGEKPTTPIRRLRSERRAVEAVPHVSCVKIAKDGMVYVCDRQNNRIQVFQKDGKFVKEAFVVERRRPATARCGTSRSRRTSRLLFVADGHDKKVWMLDRASLETVGSFGDGGRYPGPVLRRRQRRGRLEGQRLHRRDLRRQARAEVREEVTMTTRSNAEARRTRRKTIFLVVS